MSFLERVSCPIAISPAQRRKSSAPTRVRLDRLLDPLLDPLARSLGASVAEFLRTELRRLSAWRRRRRERNELFEFLASDHRAAADIGYRHCVKAPGQRRIISCCARDT
jgi:uncharacterized protein YjiS (DUF1127 family)